MVAKTAIMGGCCVDMVRYRERLHRHRSLF
jgi:hypothetical protein